MPLLLDFLTTKTFFWQEISELYEKLIIIKEKCEKAVATVLNSEAASPGSDSFFHSLVQLQLNMTGILIKLLLVCPFLLQFLHLSVLNLRILSKGPLTQFFLVWPGQLTVCFVTLQSTETVYYLLPWLLLSQRHFTGDLRRNIHFLKGAWLI